MGKLIFSVDDSNVIKTNLEAILNTAGFEHMHAFDGVQAQKLLKQLEEESRQVSLILCDINMPGMNGLELLKWIKGQDFLRFVPVIMLTTESEIATMQQAKQLGAAGWIIKPFEEEQLLDIIRKFLR
jgi:two-component system chemotaxis response regulator CheY